MTTGSGALELTHPGGVTTIRVGNGVLGKAVADAGDLFVGRSIYAVSSPAVLELHGSALAPLAEAAAAFTLLDVPDGEEAKQIPVVERLWERLASGGGKRDSVVVAFGGGSVGDVAGFAAATFLRGVAYVQIPTTLLAQVDAAIGGKTGIDLAAGKNLVGAFHHPRCVISDTCFLATLPVAELRSGLVEAIKMAALFDVGLMDRIESDFERLCGGDPEALAPVVRAAAAIKVAVVGRDPAERGDRQLLNYGHTLGHALEAAGDYSWLRHGEAVGWGMRFAHRLARRRGADESFLSRLEQLLDRLQLPVPAAADLSRLLELIARDKKARSGGLTWVLPLSPGLGERVEGISWDVVEEELNGFLRDLAARRANI